MTDANDLSWVWAIGLITFAFGIAVGVAVSRFFSGGRKRNEELREELDSLQQRFDSYRNEVGDHFLRTSELVQKMTDSYREVYEHLASGSQALCQAPIAAPRLDIPATARFQSEKPQPVVPRSGTVEYSDAEIDSLRDANSDEYLGDSPHVPKLDIEEPAPETTRRSPSG